MVFNSRVHHGGAREAREGLCCAALARPLIDSRFLPQGELALHLQGPAHRVAVERARKEAEDAARPERAAAKA